MKANWTDRSRLEKRLLLCVALLLVLLGGVTWSWIRQLIPWATAVGTIADWVGALATLGGFWAAVHTLRKGAADATAREEAAERREQERRRMEAARVAVSWESNSSSINAQTPDGEFVRLWRHTVRILNSGTSPVTHAYIWLNNTEGPWKWTGHNSIKILDTLLPGTEKTITYDINWGLDTIDPSKITVGELTGFGFRDVHGQCWLNEEGTLTPVRSEEAYAANA